MSRTEHFLCGACRLIRLIFDISHSLDIEKACGKSDELDRIGTRYRLILTTLRHPAIRACEVILAAIGIGTRMHIRDLSLRKNHRHVDDLNT